MEVVRERERGREKETDRQTETDRDGDRERDTDRHREREGEGGRERERRGRRERDRQTDRQTDRGERERGLGRPVQRKYDRVNVHRSRESNPHGLTDEVSPDPPHHRVPRGTKLMT